MIVRTATGDIELSHSGPLGCAAIVAAAHTAKTGPIRIVLPLSPRQCLDVARQLIVIASSAIDPEPR